jgi:formylmethanofuran dehydrogenase subunit B
MSRIISDVACTVCGSVCDDLRITADSERILAAERACSLAEPWFLAQRANFDQDIAHIDGQAVPPAEAYSRATEMLLASKYPLIYGLSRSTTEGQRAAVELADRLGGTIDTTASTGHAPSILALQQVGESTCTLGEVKQRADLVIFWGSDPLTTHPRHIERYCPPKSGREIVAVDSQETPTARIADHFVHVEPEADWETLWTLRMLVRGVIPETPLAATNLVDLAERMKSCKFGIIFFGTGLTRGTLAHRTIEALLQLVTDLNQHTRFYARRMRRYGDVAGADSVLAWQTGYPFGVNFAAGYPRYNPGEFTAPEMLSRGEPDLALILGSETLRDFPNAAREHLARIPTIVLDPPGQTRDFEPTVRFTTAVYGVHKPGTAYRLDEVPIPLRVLLPTTLPSDAEVLNQLRNRLQSHRTDSVAELRASPLSAE